MRLRWWELAPEAVLVAGLTFFLIDEPTAALSAFSSLRADVLMTSTALIWIVGRLFVLRFLRWPAVRALPFAVGAALVLAVVVLPAYRDHKVVETLTTGPAINPSPPAPATPPTPDATAAPMAMITSTGPAMPAEPVRIRVSSFHGIDHRASGAVNIYRRPDGSHVVGLESFDIQPGPDYDVYLVPGANRQDRSGGRKLDDLRGNSGTQFYDVPGDLDITSGAWTVLIWCQTFGVPVANATPS